MFKQSIEDEKSAGKALLVLFAGGVAAFLCFVILSFTCFTVVHFVLHGGTEHCWDWYRRGVLRIVDNPTYFFMVYADWWGAFIRSIRTLSPVWILFLPLIAPAVSALVLYSVFCRSSYSFALWYILNYHFAKPQDVQKMGLTDGTLMVLGGYEGKQLGLQNPGAVLCLGETGCGKTSTVAIPSILRSDGSSIITIDNTGTLAKYTSGYRATKGPVFYYNWDLADEQEKGAIYPRWNPLSEGNLPPAGKERDEYISYMAAYIVAGDGQVQKDNYWDWLASGALAALIGFMTAKCSQAVANDYFLNKILENGRLNKDDKDILLSYYACMPVAYSKKAIDNISKEKLDVDDYFPIGSWEGIPVSWQGKDLCLGMITDWLLKNYLQEKAEQNNGDWRHWLEQLLTEAAVFSYGESIILGLQQFLYLSKQQRQLVFAYVLKPLRVFLHQNLRERTGGNDLSFEQLRGIFDTERQKLRPITVYMSANTKTSKFVSRLFVEMLVRFGILNATETEGLPILLVADDAGQMLRLNELAKCVSSGPSRNTSVLMLCNSLSQMERNYGREILEGLVANTNYKIIMAENSAKMSRLLDKLAIFATSSVQIPADGQKLFKPKKHVADAIYYHRLAKYLQVKRNLKVETKGYQLLLAEGYYHLPILTSNVHFLRDNNFRGKATLDAAYFIDDSIFKRRNMQDETVPDIDEVLSDADFGIDDEMELDQYIKVELDEAQKNVPEDNKIETVMINDISEKWQRISVAKKENEQHAQDEWWMSENAFGSGSDDALQNPFVLKK